jgi:hypothetical protein
MSGIIERAVCICWFYLGFISWSHLVIPSEICGTTLATINTLEAVTISPLRESIEIILLSLTRLMTFSRRFPTP